MSDLVPWAVTALGGVAYGLLLFVVADGLALIVGVMNVMNLAHGASYLAGAYLACWLADGTLTGLAVAVLAGIAAAAIAGAGLSVLLKPLAGHTEQAAVTLGIGFIASWAFTRLTGGNTLSPPRPAILDGHLSFAGHGYPVYDLTFIVLAIPLAAGMYLIVRRSMAGIRLRAAVDDPLMAAAQGLSVARIRTIALATGTMLAVTAGVLGAPVIGPGPGVDSHVLTLSLIVVILGGAGTNIRALLTSALLVGMVENIGVATVPALASFSLFLIVIAVLVVRGHRQAVSAA
ncbi:branched-chain amino acid ABC transporter permease [Winogradskya humida]|uniref:branched-chain amino acid ABC transporter permease n=1 Tax=Winogradskya humida TaxID=113566 RepID=UPI001943AF25|nr:branched-chain amino acid ABC transporter permease [Actinoplanes humidus]